MNEANKANRTEPKIFHMASGAALTISQNPDTNQVTILYSLTSAEDMNAVYKQATKAALAEVYNGFLAAELAKIDKGEG